MYCKYCGKQIADDSKFCRYCGGNLIEEQVEEGTIVSKTNENETVTVESFNDDMIVVSPDNAEQIISSEPIVEEKLEGETTSIASDDNTTDKEQNNDAEETNSTVSIEDGKIMKILGIASGVLMWGMFSLFGLGLLVGVLFLVYIVIMMTMPNGMGILLFCVILAITLYLLVKLVMKIIKGVRE